METLALKLVDNPVYYMSYSCYQEVCKHEGFQQNVATFLRNLITDGALQLGHFLKNMFHLVAL